VRVAAAQGLARVFSQRAELEEHIAPLLSDDFPRVSEIAALVLLESEVRAAAGLQWQFERFWFENMRASHRSHSGGDQEERPLQALDTKPPFLDQARSLLPSATADQMVALALLLAQHGEFDGVDRLLADGADAKPDGSDAALAGIALSRDARYIPFLRRVTENASDERELRKVLRALRGMSGADARELRLEINRRMRSVNE
jgi:hypothetical protein